VFLLKSNYSKKCAIGTGLACILSILFSILFSIVVFTNLISIDQNLLKLLFALIFYSASSSTFYARKYIKTNDIQYLKQVNICRIIGYIILALLILYIIVASLPFSSLPVVFEIKPILLTIGCQ
jgi:uncharacterized protein YacL